MGQLTIYLDDKTLKAVERFAAKEKSSISKWVKKRIIRYLKNDWPPSFIKTLGSIKESDLVEPSELEFKDDLKREPL